MCTFCFRLRPPSYRRRCTDSGLSFLFERTALRLTVDGLRGPQSGAPELLERELEGLLRGGRPAAAERAFRRQLGEDPRDQLAWVGLAVARAWAGRPRGAADGLLAAAGLAGDAAAGCFARGLAALLTGDPGAAAARFGEAIGREPDRAVCYAFRGVAHGLAGDRASALADYGRAIALLPGEFGFYMVRGLALHREANFEAAVDDFSEAVRLEPDHPIAHSETARSLAALGRDAEAEAEGRKAVELYYGVSFIGAH